MWMMLLCLMNQLTPTEVHNPTVDEFRQVCEQLKREQIAADREDLKALEPSEQRFVQPTPTQRAEIRREIRALELELKKIERERDLLPVPQLLIQELQPGQIGELYSRVVQTENLAQPDQPGGGAVIERTEIRPAVLTILRAYRPKAIVCACDSVEVVLLHYDGRTPQAGETLELSGLYRVAGEYKVARKTLIAIEPWDHNALWQRRFMRPQPGGRIDLVKNPVGANPQTAVGSSD